MNDKERSKRWHEKSQRIRELLDENVLYQQAIRRNQNEMTILEDDMFNLENDGIDRSYIVTLEDWE